MAKHDIIVIGASAGGVEAISTLVSRLPADLPAALMIVLHLSRGRSVLPGILSRAGPLPAKHPEDGEALQRGQIYVAPPDHHLIVDGPVARLVQGPTENGVRPAVDPLFRSAARSYGPRVVGIVLTGSLDDGTAGLAAIKEAGGVTIVQDPAEAFAPSMPRSALDFVEVEYVLPLREMPLLLAALTREQAVDPPRPAAAQLHPMEPDLASERVAVDPSDRPGRVSVFSCPECHGSLWEVDQKGILRFRCRVGHVYSVESMLAAQTDSVDRALWAALRSLEERAALTRRLSERAKGRRQQWMADAFAARADVAESHASVVREILVTRSVSHVVPDHGEPAEPGTAPPVETAATLRDD
jgi:two-component system chemotaxis response regulator CheB